VGPFRKSKPIEEMSPKELEKAAVKSRNKRDWKSGERYLRALIMHRPGFGAAYTELATCLVNLDRPDEALEQIETAISIAPDDATLIATSGLLIGGTGSNYPKAIELIERAQSLGFKDKGVDQALLIFKQKAWIHLPPITGDNILVINQTIDPEALKPVEDPALKAQLKEGQVAIDIEPILDFIGEIAKEAMEAGKTVSMRDLCQKGGIISNQKGKDVVGIAGQKHGFTANYQIQANSDILATFSPS